MKCARELMNTVETAEIRRIKREAQIAANSRQAAARYAEEVIAPSLEYVAKHYNHVGTNRLLGFTNIRVDGVWMVAPLKETSEQYAKSCHRTSYDVDESRAFLLSHLVEYLEQYCYKVRRETDYYFRYNWGRQTGVRIYVIPKPEC